jgi:alkylation response protein AidB-like acyl-CoA dehydrogenase
MSTYAAPIRDIRFAMHELAGLAGLSRLPGLEEASPDLVDAILEEAARFTGEVLAPLNATGDRRGAQWADGEVITPPGFREAYRAFAANGWNGIGCPQEFGGQGMPHLVAAAVTEMTNAANMAFALCPLLSAGAIHALLLSGSPRLQQAYLPRMVSGEWTGTMNLTEPQAGSDLALVRTRAEPLPDGSYRIFGQKVFITYGEHDLADNIVHLVLARLPDAPAGVKGISLFVVPKYLPGADGGVGVRNDVRCVSIEHKLGIHASPTAVLAFGDHGGAIGDLVGEPNRGLEYMFIMMNDARFAVGVQGLAVAERAYQQALAYARERLQGRGPGRNADAVTIIHHPDVRRMLLLMKSQIEAMRALAYVVAAAQDTASQHPDPGERARNRAFAELMIPVVKGWCTENSIEIASLGVQVHGGMGYIEETGAAQHLRDARITTIYEGTTGIQANDLIVRKIGRDGGAALRALIDAMRATAAQLASSGGTELATLRDRLGAGIEALASAADFVVAGQGAQEALAGAVPFLKLLGIVAGGWQTARAALIAQRRLREGTGDAPYYEARIVVASFFAEHVLPLASGLAYSVVQGGASVNALAEERF